MVNMVFLVFSLFYVVGFVCLIIGIYFLYLNINTAMNKLVFLFCMSFGCWCIGDARSHMALSYVDSIVWQRFAMIGTGMFCSLFLHYIMLLTEHKEIFKKRWVKFVIYMPAMITVFIFSLSENITKYLYLPEKTSFGWINMTQFNSRLAFLDLYIYSFMLIGIYLIYQWKVKTKDKYKKKQAGYLLISSLVPLAVIITGEIMDKLSINSLLREVAPIFLIVPIMNACYAIKTHHFTKIYSVKEDIEFMDQFRTKITKYLAEAFGVGGCMFFGTQYMKNNNFELSKVVSFTVILFLFGLVVYLVRKQNISKDLKLMLYATILSISIPVITLQYISSASISVWAFPFIILIAALLFNNTTILTMIATSIIITQLYMWIKIPSCVVTVDTTDYIARVGLMGLAIVLIYYINNIYLLRLKQLSDKVKTQDLLFLITSRSINVNHNNLKKKMNEILNLFCTHINADRAYVYYYKNLEDVTKDFYCDQWCNMESNINIGDFQDTSVIGDIWWENQIEKYGTVQILNVMELPPEAVDIKEFLTKQNVKSMLAVPLTSKGKKIGFMRIDYVQKLQAWDQEFVKLLMTVGNIIGESNIRASSELKMQHMAYYDQLTNTPNRNLFGEFINQTIKSAGRQGNLFSVIFLNVDSFKVINNTMGHQCGDNILIIIADRLKKCLRKSDIVCRFGGDEFIIMLDDINSNRDIETVVNKIIKQFEEPFLIGNQEFYITASVGISVFPIDGEDKETLIKNADIAMYMAKNNGKNQFIFCSQKMKDDIHQTMVLTNNLYHAVEKCELQVAYQPQVETKTGKIIAMEALARWIHPELGNISPALFIPIAEHTGLINSIGEWVLKKACVQNKTWQDRGLTPVRMAVNVSVKQLLKPHFVEKVREILEETILEPCYLELEITENIAMQESDYIFNVLADLKGIGISLAIDDFGIEYSSLSRIKMLPIDRLKIDMNFISGILNNEKDKVIVDVIIKLAQDLKLKVIAEGVEKREQLDYLSEKNCDEIQGYYFYKPLSQSDMEEVLINMK